MQVSSYEDYDDQYDDDDGPYNHDDEGHTWGSRELLSFKKFITVLENKCVCIKEDCFGELGQFPTVDLQQGAEVRNQAR